MVCVVFLNNILELSKIDDDIFFLGMSRGELVDTLARLTVHNDEELRGLACQGLQNLVIDFPDWREDVLYGFMQFVVKVRGRSQTTFTKSRFF